MVVLLLDHVYDPGQLWLPFETTFIYVNKLVVETDTYNNDGEYERHVSRKNREGRMSRKNREHRIKPLTKQMYNYCDNAQQYQLPFSEFCQVIGCEQFDLTQHNYPCWDRDSNGILYQAEIHLSAMYVDLFRKWFSDNAPGRYMLLNHTTNSCVTVAVFSHYDAYVMVTLIDSNGDLEKNLDEWQ